MIIRARSGGPGIPRMDSVVFLMFVSASGWEGGRMTRCGRPGPAGPGPFASVVANGVPIVIVGSPSRSLIEKVDRVGCATVTGVQVSTAPTTVGPMSDVALGSAVTGGLRG